MSSNRPNSRPRKVARPRKRSPSGVKTSTNRERLPVVQLEPDHVERNAQGPRADDRGAGRAVDAFATPCSGGRRPPLRLTFHSPASSGTSRHFRRPLAPNMVNPWNRSRTKRGTSTCNANAGMRYRACRLLLSHPWSRTTAPRGRAVVERLRSLGHDAVAPDLPFDDPLQATRSAPTRRLPPLRGRGADCCRGPLGRVGRGGAGGCRPGRGVAGLPVCTVWLLRTPARPRRFFVTGSRFRPETPRDGWSGTRTRLSRRCTRGYRVKWRCNWRGVYGPALRRWRLSAAATSRRGDGTDLCARRRVLHRRMGNVRRARVAGHRADRDPGRTFPMVEDPDALGDLLDRLARSIRPTNEPRPQ